MDTREESAHRIVHLRFKPLWLYVDALREFCGFFARATFKDRDLGQRVALVVHELVENAIRYGDDIELELQVERHAAGMAVSVTNTTSEEQAEMLTEAFKQLEGTDPANAYLEAVRASVEKPATVSGLGLPRIRHEGQVELALTRGPGRVTVTAAGSL